MKKTISIILVLVLSLVSVSQATEDTWTRKVHMPTTRYVLSSSVVDGIIYAIGGYGGNRTVEAYDPVTDTWTRKANMPMSREAGTSSMVNEKIYVMAGVPYFMGPNYSSVIEYDSTKDTWTTKADIPTARSCLSSSAVNGKIYAIGGALDYQGTVLSTVEEYDPLTDTWTSKADMPTPRAFVSTSVVNGKIYAIGGNLRNPWYQGLTTVEEYDPATDTWTMKADMPTGRTYFSTCVANGKIYAVGGLTTGNNNHLSTVEEYDPATDSWRRVADIPTARSGLTTSEVNGKIYAIGGWIGGGTTVSTVEEYTPHSLIIDFNGDGIVDSADICMMIDNWHTDAPLYDIYPIHTGDGIVDVQDLAALSEYIFEDINDSTLAAHWALDETEGMAVADSAGDNNGYALGEPVWQPDAGLVDGALQLDGVDDYVITGAVPNPADGPFSVLAWIKGGLPGQVVIAQQFSANWFLANAEGNLMTELTSRSRSGKPLQSETIITDGNWHRIGLVWDGSNRILYVDGVAVAQDTQQNLGGSESGLYIGCGKGTELGSYFSGLIDDVRIYNRVVIP